MSLNWGMYRNCKHLQLAKDGIQPCLINVPCSTIVEGTAYVSERVSEKRLTKSGIFRADSQLWLGQIKGPIAVLAMR